MDVIVYVYVYVCVCVYMCMCLYSMNAMNERLQERRSLF